MFQKVELGQKPKSLLSETWRQGFILRLIP